MMSAVFAALLFLPQFFQKILGDNPLEAGAGLLPMMVVFAVTSFVAGGLYERLGAKVIVTAGAVCLTAGAFLISLIDSDSGYGAVVPGMVVLYRRRLFYSSITTAAVTALDPSRSSLAGGLVYMFQVAAGRAGLTTTVFVTASEDSLQKDLSGSRLDKSDVDALHGALAGTESSAEILARFSRGAADRILELIREAFAAGMQWASGSWRRSRSSACSSRCLSWAARYSTGTSLRRSPLSHPREARASPRGRRGCARASLPPGGSISLPALPVQRRDVHSRSPARQAAAWTAAPSATSSSASGTSTRRPTAARPSAARSPAGAAADQDQRRGRVEPRAELRQLRSASTSDAAAPSYAASRISSRLVECRRPAIIPAARGRFGVRSPSR